MIETDKRKTVNERSIQCMALIQSLKMLSAKIVSDIGKNNLTAKLLLDYQRQLVQMKANFANWPHGSLTDTNVATQLFTQWPDHYTSAIDVQDKLATITQDFTNLQAEIEAVLVIARSVGQLIDADSITGLELTQPLTSPTTDSLVVVATTIRSGING